LSALNCKSLNSSSKSMLLNMVYCCISCLSIDLIFL
jgi:hypothetical protein